MYVDFSSLKGKFNTVAIAVSGGSDSMALLHYAFNNEKSLGIKVIALNVEHGIRGKTSVSDSLFVKEYCRKYGIPLLEYKVNSLKKAKAEKLTVEQAARILRYECFYDAINSGKCDVIATAHHLRDNFESVLFNLFRGTGIKGLKGINDYDGKIIRPFIKVSKAEIESYIKENAIPFVTDETNFDENLTRNFIRQNIIPKIEQVFPEAESCIARLSESAKIDDEYLELEADKVLSVSDNAISIPKDVHKAIFFRAVVKALKYFGITKDWEKVHLESAYSLTEKETGSYITLPKGVKAIREYDKIVFTKSEDGDSSFLPFKVGTVTFNGEVLKIEKILTKDVDLKSGLYLDLDKLPKNSVIRTKQNGDVFTKFGGGTKLLSDYLTDKKIPLRFRNKLPLIASGNEIYGIFGVAISDKVKVTSATKDIIKITKDE